MFPVSSFLLIPPIFFVRVLSLIAFVCDFSPVMQDSLSESPFGAFKLDQRVHSAGDPRRVGTVKYVGPVERYGGVWVGVDWDNGEGKHDGSINGVRYFRAKSERSGSFVRTHSLSGGISLLEALYVRYRSESTKEEEGMPSSFLMRLISFHGPVGVSLLVIGK